MQSPASSIEVLANKGGNFTNKTDKILSEIAEEDSISMISDRPRRFKPSDCVTPVDPVTNSFMQGKDAQSRLKDIQASQRM